MKTPGGFCGKLPEIGSYVRVGKYWWYRITRMEPHDTTEKQEFVADGITSSGRSRVTYYWKTQKLQIGVAWCEELLTPFEFELLSATQELRHGRF